MPNYNRASFDDCYLMCAEIWENCILPNVLNQPVQAKEPEMKLSNADRIKIAYTWLKENENDAGAKSVSFEGLAKFINNEKLGEKMLAKFIAEYEHKSDTPKSIQNFAKADEALQAEINALKSSMNDKTGKDADDCASQERNRFN